MTDKKPTKIEFILAQPATASARDVVAAGKRMGLDFSLGYVHTTRSKAGKTKRVALKAQKRTPAMPGRKLAQSTDGDLLRQYDVLALRIGYDAAQERLESPKGRLYGA